MKKQGIRRKAEQIVNQTYVADNLLDELNGQDVRQVLHELRVHQVELEMQNEELRRTQASLITTRKHYLDLYNFAPVAYLTLDRYGVIKNINLFGAKMMGRERRYLLNRPLLPHLHPNHYTRFFEYLESVFSRGVRIRTELRLANNQLHVAVDAVATQVDEDTINEGETLCQMVMTDITDLYQTQRDLRVEKEQLAITLCSIADGVIVTDAEGVIQLVNPSALAMLGSTLDRLEGKKLADGFRIFEEDSNSALSTNMLFAPDMALLPDVVLLQTHANQQLMIQLSVAPIQDGDDITGIILVFRDETAKRKQQADRLRTQKLEALGTLAGGIAHDFNNLLTGIFGHLELAKIFLPADHKSCKHLELAFGSMERATSLANQLFTFAKGGAPMKEVVQIGDMIVETARFSLGGSNVSLQSVIDPELFPVEVDKGQINQVISNLIINAQQAMPQGGTVILSAKNVQSAGKHAIEITIQDGGIGIDSRNLDKIFDPYFTTKPKGSGLGLAITYSIIRKHNGTITVDSQLNRGTTFTISLPKMEGQAEPIANNRLIKHRNGAIDRAQILVMDDEAVIRDVIGELLEGLGHTVTFALDGYEAVAKYQAAYQTQSAYDAVIVDLTIPGSMGGQEATQEILSINPQAKIIVSSGYATDPIMANYKQYGFQARAVKPYRCTELQTIIQQVLDD